MPRCADIQGHFLVREPLSPLHNKRIISRLLVWKGIWIDSSVPCGVAIHLKYKGKHFIITQFNNVGTNRKTNWMLKHTVVCKSITLKDHYVLICPEVFNTIRNFHDKIVSETNIQ